MLIFNQTGGSCKWTYDSQRFLLKSFDLISNSPSHIYHSALPFAPSSSWLHECYTAQLSQEVKVVKGLPAEWGARSRTVETKGQPLALACWKDTIAVNSALYIIILNAITGSQVAVLSGHTNEVQSLTFSLDGALLVSGSHDKTVKLWDLQTGGVIKTFCGHTGIVCSVSISPNNTILASGAWDKSIRLWGVSTGECLCVIDRHSKSVECVSFSPTNSQHLVSSSDHTIKQWDISGCQIGPTHRGDGVAFSLDGTLFVSWLENVATLQNSESGVVVKLEAPSNKLHCCCFSPSGEFMAGSVDRIIYVWDIACSDPYLFKTFVGHTAPITALTFSSSLISASKDETVRFWEIGALSTDQVTTDLMPTPPTSTSIKSLSLQARKGVAISSDSNGVVKTWDISTGLCKASFQTPAIGNTWRDAQLIEGRLILIWHAGKQIYIWDIEKDELLQTVDASVTHGLRISEDGSKVFGLTDKSIQAWWMWTGEAVGRVEFENNASHLDPLHGDGSRIWVCFENSSTKGWDFGIPGSSHIPLSDALPNRPYLKFIFYPEEWGTGPSRIEDIVTGTTLFQLAGRYANPHQVCWDGRYLVAEYWSEEVLILDFNHLVPQ